MPAPDDLTEYLHSHIPLTRHLGVRVAGLDDASARLCAPLAANLNHRDTAFGGTETPCPTGGASRRREGRAFLFREKKFRRFQSFPAG